MLQGWQQRLPELHAAGLPGWALWQIPGSDPDCDGISTSVETFMGTDSTHACANTRTADDEPLPDRWPVDFNDDQKASLSDVLEFVGVFNSAAPGPPYNVRFDLNADNRINLSDVLSFVPFFNHFCGP